MCPGGVAFRPIRFSFDVRRAVERNLSEFPRASIRLGFDDGPLGFTKQGYDLAARVGLLGEGDLRATKLMDNPVCICASPGWIDRHGVPANPSELSRLPAVGVSALFS
ncbi:MAG: LysR substrate-binding domain-containing protein [Myxococcota bacterium]